MKKILYFIGLLCLIFLSGCVQYNEKLIFNPDWSGRLSFRIGIGEAFDDFQEEVIKEELGQVDGLRVIASKTYNQEGVRWVEFDVEFDHLEALAAVDSIFSEPGFIGKISIEADDEGNILYTRELAKKESADDNEMLENILSEFYWTYQTVFPKQVISANVGEDKIDKETNTIEWKINMAALLSDPQIMSATIKNPQTMKITWPLLIVGIVVLLALLLCLYLFIIKSRRKRATGIENVNSQVN